jgi:capsular polysaccharide biosynthesis protein
MTETLVYADRLITYQDHGQGSHKQARYAQIRDRLHARFGGGDATGCVYLCRGRTGATRLIVNEAALIDDLVARNWQILDIASASVAQLQRALCRARVVVSIDGSHLAHAHLALRPGALMVVLMPHDRFTSIHLGYCRAHGVIPAMVVLLGAQGGGYQVNLDELLRTIDLATA